MIPAVARAAAGARSVLIGSSTGRTIFGALGLGAADSAGLPVTEVFESTADMVGSTLGALFGSAGEAFADELFDNPLLLGLVVAALIATGYMVISND